MTHTKGPWHQTDNKKRTAIYINGEGWGQLAKVWVRLEGSDTDSEEGVCNANLITAAPELLSALMAISYKMADGIAPNDHEEWCKFFIETADKAIKKAKQ